MWIVELAFTPAPERLAARPAHRDRLTALHRDGVVRLAGPLADDSGAVILLDVPNRTEVDEFLAADPYFQTPGVEVRAVRAWAPFLH
ncbi:hypothetical protein Q0Z83_007830 [Actinoplanes sichuanensis]|uniref:YciI family protein n=1 Tax=Actinoplanes sichuanensis TaxID=512349 RepID=A0ABW4AGI9_9ACTN|nr:YciI family protein [Actinoplanes sichuanensis]BEL02592.1 hypothetical protein Q0Z83_007830 [Actinoplanes sichuanensis]